MATDADSTAGLLLVVIAVIVLLPVLMMLFFAPAMGTHMGLDGNSSVWWTVPWIVVVLVLGYVIYTVASPGSEDDAVRELRRAYARGDLTDEEYEERRNRLASSNGRPRTDTED